MVYCRTITTHSLPVDTKKVASQPKALEIAMKMEASPIGDGREMAQV
jgi:hypothetical protein